MQASTELLCFLATSRDTAYIEMRDKVSVWLQTHQQEAVMPNQSMFSFMLKVLPHYILHDNTLC